MISLSYINGSDIDIPAYDPFKVFESDLNDILDAVNTASKEYHEAMNEYNLSVEFFETGDDTKLEAAEEKKTNFVDRIGAAIIEVGRKAVAFITNIINKIQESLFANKSDMQKVSALCKKNPGMADEINKAFKEGNLQVADIKSIKDLEATYDEIMRLAKQEKVDPNTLKGKWIAAKKRFGSLSEADIIKGLETSLKVAGTAAGLVITIGNLPTAISNIKNWRQNAKDKTELAELTLQAARNNAETSSIKLQEARDQAERNKESHKSQMDLNELKKKGAEMANNITKNNEARSEIQLNDAKRNSAMGQKQQSANLQRARDEASAASSKKQKATIDLAKSINSLRKESVEDLCFDENGYMVESASDAMQSVIASIHADMMKICTALASFNFKSLSRAKAIIAAAIRGYEKTPKTIDKKEDKKEEDENEDDEE